MLDRFGIAVVEERRFDRRRAALRDYLQMEYGSASGMERYIAEGNHTSFPRSGLRAFLAKIFGKVVRSRTPAATPAVSAEGMLGDDCAEHVTAVAKATPVPAARPVGYRGRLNVRPRTVLPPLKR
ncbi:MAG: hypothetical protein ACE5I4_05085 [Thermoplasmata archaeon]